MPKKSQMKNHIIFWWATFMSAAHRDSHSPSLKLLSLGVIEVHPWGVTSHCVSCAEEILQHGPTTDPAFVADFSHKVLVMSGLVTLKTEKHINNHVENSNEMKQIHPVMHLLCSKVCILSHHFPICSPSQFYLSFFLFPTPATHLSS